MYKSAESNKVNSQLNIIEREIDKKTNLQENLDKLLELSENVFFKARIYNDIGSIYLELGLFQEGLNVFEKLYEVDTSLNTLLKLAPLLIELRQIDRLKNYIDMLDNYDEQNYMKGYLESKIGNYKESNQYYNRLRFTYLEYYGVLRIGLNYLKMNQIDKALDCFRKLLTTEHKHEALIYLMNIALSRGEDIDILLRQFEIDKCDSSKLIKKYGYIVSYYKYKKGELTKDNISSNYEYQLLNYNYESVLRHIYNRHKKQDFRYHFYDDVSLESLYNYCKDHLDTPTIGGTDDNYIIDYPRDIGYLMDQTTNRLHVKTLPNTDKILTIFPIVNLDEYVYENKKKK